MHYFKFALSLYLYEIKINELNLCYINNRFKIELTYRVILYLNVLLYFKIQYDAHVLQPFLMLYTINIIHISKAIK